MYLIKDKEHTCGARVTNAEAIKLIEDRMGIQLKRTFLATLRKLEPTILEVRTEYDDGLRRNVKNRLQDLCEKLEEFYVEMDEAGAPVTDEVLMHEAKEIAKVHALILPECFNFSMDWLLRWKRKRGIGQKEMHGESGGACQAGIDLCRRHLPGILREFDLELIYNLDETGLFYRRLPTRALIRALKKGQKLSKLRCTVNVIANATGNDIHLQVIGTAKRPRAFGRSMKPYETYHIDYYHNKTAWMRTDIFIDVIQKFSNRMAQKTKKMCC